VDHKEAIFSKKFQSQSDEPAKGFWTFWRHLSSRASAHQSSSHCCWAVCVIFPLWNTGRFHVLPFTAVSYKCDGRPFIASAKFDDFDELISFLKKLKVLAREFWTWNYSQIDKNCQIVSKNLWNERAVTSAGGDDRSTRFSARTFVPRDASFPPDAILTFFVLFSFSLLLLFIYSDLVGIFLGKQFQFYFSFKMTERSARFKFNKLDIIGGDAVYSNEMLMRLAAGGFNKIFLYLFTLL
jgi:hypothetical protein